MPFSSFPSCSIPVIILAFLIVAQAKPGTNFASSSVTSDGSGTRSTHLVGAVPDSSSNPSGPPSLTVYNIPATGSGNGATLVTTRNGAGSGATLVSSGSGTNPSGSGSSSTLLSSGSGTNPSGSGNAVGILTRSGPSSGSGGQYTTVLGSGNGVVTSGGRGSGSGTYVRAGGASSGAFAGSGGVSGAFANANLPSMYFYDYSDY